MPVSHIGLTVYEIPKSVSFYLAALQPLGYRYIGQQGDSIGLGITDADFFLTQEQNGYVDLLWDVLEVKLTRHRLRPSPTHIAFAADDSATVRECYAAALNASGHASGAPSQRNNDCSCFNAAVTDPDGNTIEFIFREPCRLQEKSAPSQISRSQTWQDGVPRSGVQDDVRSLASKTSQARSRAETVRDVASKASKSMNKSTAPRPGITRSRTEPITSTPQNGGKALVGTLLGAAAGAAFAYAMVSSERDSARDEQAFAAATRSRASSDRDGRPRNHYDGSTVSKKSHRTEISSRHPNRSMRAIEAPVYYDDDDNKIQDVISNYKSSRRPAPQRSQTYDAIEYVPRSTASGRSDRFSTKRSSTLPIDMPHYLIEGPKTAPASRHTSRRGSMEDATRLKRHDSGVSMNSHRSRRHSSFDGGRRSSASKASTTKPPRRGSLYQSAANVPLPSSKAQSYISAADMPPPKSRATSYISAAHVPIPPSRTNGGYTDAGEESDGLSDTKTVLPEDSISCSKSSAHRPF